MYGYCARETTRDRLTSPRIHTTACLTASVDAFCDDEPDPGCTCGATARETAREFSCTTPPCAAPAACLTAYGCVVARATLDLDVVEQITDLLDHDDTGCPSCDAAPDAPCSGSCESNRAR